MPGWSRQRSESKLAAWAKSQDIATVERELERTEKDIRRAGSVSLNPEYVLKRQQERARARDATGRLSTIGLRLDLGPFMFDQPPPPPPTPVSSSKVPIQTNNDQREILHLRNELSKLKTREGELEKALLISERKRDEERKSHERERKIMISTIRKLKGEVEDGWSRMIRLREKYEGPVFPVESGRNSSRKIYQTDESFETIYRPSSRRVSLEDSPDRCSPSNLSRRPSSSHLNRPGQSALNHPHLADSIGNPSALGPRPRTASILKNPLGEGSASRTRRTSFS
ncbi:hypothetical protein PCANC_02255 [Puccinia coronata f. sp. avenae]|uniref:Uncharacterized protein n=1 Tax=Puccinia coronata f. sp. avenae TaxID=200324 RepID=A0A2N5W0W0_9BASI|nr:hypothetical protein PCASD_25499 [Puccinia coronata f. sp. avenae]PLW13607.1 hypothetical protein PCANC_16316 [Puccinia coronata f. sp. avenae]PLW26589.1 hypothetical protein PCASD_20880 [Puccinia coronata f. sp. avenae]PLW55822.1 hypothetical protein PCANC_02255 [Puccinia coronata f. sp. avenae]